MTFIDLLMYLFLSIIGGGVGYFLWRYFGPIYGIIGFFAGIATGLGLLDIFSSVLSKYEKHFPLRPICRNGRCVSSDYQWLHEEEAGDVFQCKCGDTYIKSGNKFMVLTLEKAAINYMKRNILGRWKPDDNLV